MNTIKIDVGAFSKAIEFYSAAFAALGAPSWQGFSVAAFVDSAILHNVLQIQPPYILEVSNFNEASDEIQKEILNLQAALINARVEHELVDGTDVEVSVSLALGHGEGPPGILMTT